MFFRNGQFGKVTIIFETYTIFITSIHTIHSHSPPIIQLIPKPSSFTGKFVQYDPKDIKFGDDCYKGSAIYVTCVSLKCGIRSDYNSQNMREVHK